MKKFCVALMMVLYSCSPATMITGSWKSPQSSSMPYHTTLVAALTDHTVARATVETDIAGLLTQQGIKASKSIDLLPQRMINPDSSLVLLMEKIKGMDVASLLTVSVIKQDINSSGEGYPREPLLFYPYYRDYWGYSYWYPYYYPGYYDEPRYYIETDLYDAKTQNLVWSAQSKTYDLMDLATFSKQFAQSIVDRMTADGIISGKAKESQSVGPL